MSRQAVTLSIMDCEGETSNYAGGIGYATLAGILDDERILVECSSGGREENLQHTYGDSLKVLESLTAPIFLLFDCIYHTGAPAFGKRRDSYLVSQWRILMH